MGPNVLGTFEGGGMLKEWIIMGHFGIMEGLLQFLDAIQLDWDSQMAMPDVCMSRLQDSLFPLPI